MKNARYVFHCGPSNEHSWMILQPMNSTAEITPDMLGRLHGPGRYVLVDQDAGVMDVIIAQEVRWVAE